MCVFFFYLFKPYPWRGGERGLFFRSKVNYTADEMRALLETRGPNEEDQFENETNNQQIIQAS